MDSLVSLCLSVISHNFERYFSASLAAKDGTLTTPMEFLRRAYSFQVLSKLEERNLKPVYVGFFINKYLKEFDTRWLRDFNWDSIKRKMAEIGPNLKKMSFHGNEMPWHKILCHLTNLKYLDCKYDCSGVFLDSVAQYCHKLESIDVSCSLQVSNVGMQFLCSSESGRIQCSLLKKINIRRTVVTEDGVKDLLRNLPLLEEVECECLADVLYSMHEQDFENLASVKPYNLTHLVCPDFTIHARNSVINYRVLKTCVSVCPRLKHIFCSVENQEHLEWLSKLPELKEVVLYCCSNNPLDLSDFLKLTGKTLEELTLRNSFSLSASVLTKTCPRLKWLYLQGTTFLPDYDSTTYILFNLRDLSLQFLNLKDPQVNSSISRLFSSCPNLQYLRILYCSIYTFQLEAQILEISKQCKLTDVDFHSSVVNSRLLYGILLNCTSLKSLNLFNSVLDCKDRIQRHTRLNELAVKMIRMARDLINRPKIGRDIRNVDNSFLL